MTLRAYHMAFRPRFIAAAALFLAVSTAWAQAPEIQEINAQFRKGDLNGALARANAFLARNPKDAQVRFLKGLILADQGKANEAITMFTGLTEDYPELPEPYNNLAVLYASQGKYDQAKNALEQAIRTHPSYATAHENLGDIYAKLASMAYDKALALDSRNTTAQTKLALIKDITSGQPRRPAGAAQPAPAQSRPAGSAQSAPAQSRPASAAPAPSGRPAAASSPTTAAAPAGSVEAAVAAWAEAWAAKNVEAYLAAYAPDYAPAGLTRANWEAQRRQRIEAPRFINVEISDLKVETTGNTATAVFRQVYKSDRLNSTGIKTLKLTQIEGQWRIVDERINESAGR